MQSRKCDFIAYYLKAEAEKKLDEFSLNSIGIEEVEAKFTIKSNNSSVISIKSSIALPSIEYK